LCSRRAPGTADASNDRGKKNNAVQTALKTEPVQDAELLKKTFALWPRGPGPRPTE